MTQDPIARMAEHLTECRKVDGLLVGEAGMDMTPVVERMLAAGWTWDGQEIVGGKRVRYLIAPKTEGQTDA